MTGGRLGTAEAPGTGDRSRLQDGRKTGPFQTSILIVFMTRERRGNFVLGYRAVEVQRFENPQFTPMSGGVHECDRNEI